MKRTIDAVSKQRGEGLRALREAHHWNQQTLADKVAEHVGRMSKSAVSAWERGENPPGRETVFALDRVFGGTGEVLALYGLGGDTKVDRLEAEVTRLRGVVGELARAVRVLAKKANVRLDDELLRDATHDVPASPRADQSTR